MDDKELSKKIYKVQDWTKKFWFSYWYTVLTGSNKFWVWGYKLKSRLLKDSLCIIPYYGGTNEPYTGHSSISNRMKYLDRTVRSVMKYFGRTILTVSNKKDFDSLIDRYKYTKPILIDCKGPKYLPCYSLMTFQNLLKEHKAFH